MTKPKHIASDKYHIAENIFYSRTATGNLEDSKLKGGYSLHHEISRYAPQYHFDSSKARIDSHIFFLFLL